MAAREQPYDPYIPSGHAAQNGGQEHAGDSRTAALQAQINETVGIMKQNLTTNELRGQKIEDISFKANNMNQESTKFRESARKVKRKMCISNWKWGFIVGGIIALTILIAVIATVEKKKNH